MVTDFWTIPVINKYSNYLRPKKEIMKKLEKERLTAIMDVIDTGKLDVVQNLYYSAPNKDKAERWSFELMAIMLFGEPKKRDPIVRQCKGSSIINANALEYYAQELLGVSDAEARLLFSSGTNYWLHLAVVGSLNGMEKRLQVKDLDNLLVTQSGHDNDYWNGISKIGVGNEDDAKTVEEFFHWMPNNCVYAWRYDPDSE